MKFVWYALYFIYSLLELLKEYYSKFSEIYGASFDLNSTFRILKRMNSFYVHFPGELRPYSYFHTFILFLKTANIVPYFQVTSRRELRNVGVSFL
jgi:hypothetical protein